MNRKLLAPVVAWFGAGALHAPAPLPADHNDPNAVNSIFSDVDVSAADLYDMFGWPADDATGGERVVLALTFASVPQTGVLDPDMLYKIKVEADPRLASSLDENCQLSAVEAYLAAVADKFLKMKAAEVRVRVRPDALGQALVEFRDFVGGSFERELACNTVHHVDTPDGQKIKVFVGGRDDAFFNDLPGFFRSINYAPQFYHVPLAMADMRELAIPKTLLELEGNKLFNFDAARPKHGQGEKLDLPATLPEVPVGAPYAKDAKGNYRFVYSGKDAQAGMNVNAIVLEIPLSYITKTPESDRVVNAWGESWVLRAAAKAEDISDDPGALGFLVDRAGWLAALAALLGVYATWRGRRAVGARRWLAFAVGLAGLLGGLGLAFYAYSVRSENDLFLRSEGLRDDFMRRYKLVDTDGVPFADAGLCERENGRQRGANNVSMGLHFVKRFAHLGWGFGPSISALGLECSFDHGKSPVSVHKVVTNLVDAFARTKKALFQPLNMPDARWNKRNLPIPLRRPFEIFVPNVNAIDMDTNGTWPFGRRLEDQVATRFLSTFLDMSAQWQGKKYHVDLLGDQSLWDAAPIEPKTPPNPLANDKPFLTDFPYLAEPWAR